MALTQRTDSSSVSLALRVPSVLQVPLLPLCVQRPPTAQRQINTSVSRVPQGTIVKSVQLIPRLALQGTIAPRVQVSALSVLLATRV